MKTSWHYAAVLAFVALFALPLVHAATIEGDVYTIDFMPASGVVVEIDTTPRQQLVVLNGSYSVRVPQGDYHLTATQRKDGIVKAQITENISVQAEGTYTLDLILFPVFGADEDLDIDVEVADEAQLSPEPMVPQQVWIGAAVIVVAAIVLWLVLRTRREQQRPTHVDIVAQPELSSTKKDLDDLVAIIKKLGGRTTQKELRKEVPYSEAKVSLVLTELEHKGIIEKIKRGRANIIILK
ncbi:MAG: hypothetical protein AABY13_05685 [Nanoarchaeota archaeon]